MKQIFYFCVFFILLNNNVFTQKNFFLKKVVYFDQNIHNYFNSKKYLSSKHSKFLDNYGKIYIYPIVLFSEMKLNKNQKLLLNPLILTISTTYVLKYATRRERPNKKNKMSFPSGHTSGSFVSAWILNNHHGLNIGLPSLIIATFVGLQRIESNNHWLSDVIVGAMIGSIYGMKKNN